MPVVCALFLFAEPALAGRVNGIYYETKGKGPPIILIHGGQLDRRMWDEQFDLFARGHRVIRYDLRGFGKSGPPVRPYSHVEDLVALLKKLQVEKASIVGLSLGAAVAADFAIVHPEKVQALVLACPGLGGFAFTNAAASTRKIVEAARDDGPAAATELWLQNRYMSVAMEHPALRDHLRQISRDNAYVWLNNPVLNRPLQPPAAQRLAEIKAPVLVIGGDRDVSDIEHIVEKLAKEVPRARKVIVSGSGHMVNLEKPQEFNRLVLEFLAANRP